MYIIIHIWLTLYNRPHTLLKHTCTCTMYRPIACNCIIHVHNYVYATCNYACITSVLIDLPVSTVRLGYTLSRAILSKLRLLLFDCVVPFPLEWSRWFPRCNPWPLLINILIKYSNNTCINIQYIQHMYIIMTLMSSIQSYMYCTVLYTRMYIYMCKGTVHCMHVCLLFWQ